MIIVYFRLIFPQVLAMYTTCNVMIVGNVLLSYICMYMCLMTITDFIKPGARRPKARAWFLEIAFVREVGMCACVCVSAPEAINYIHVILNLYN